MTVGPDLRVVASALATRCRADIVLTLMGADDVPASELAAVVRRSPATVSFHLANLVEAGLVASSRRGRHMYYRIASPEAAAAVEALSLVSPDRPVVSLKQSREKARLVKARTCYDHLAGELGVAIADSLVSRRLLRAVDGDFILTPKGRDWSERFGLRLGEDARRPLVKACLDWSHRRFHIAGQLGAQLTAALFSAGWIRRDRASRAVVLTSTGRERFAGEFDIAFDD